MSIGGLRTTLHTLFTVTADDLARQTGVIRRQRKLSGALLLQTLVFGWLAHPAASLTQLTQMAARRGVLLSPQALDRRFTPALVDCLEQFLAAALAALVAVAEPAAIPLLQRFTGVWIIASTTISLPRQWAERWRGCGGRPGEGLAALKVHLRFDLLRGRLEGPVLTPGRTQDRASRLQHAPLPRGSLRLSDLGYFSLSVFRQIAEAGSFWLSRLQVNIVVQTTTGERVTTLIPWLCRQAQATGSVDQPVLLGVKEPVACAPAGGPSTADGRGDAATADPAGCPQTRANGQQSPAGAGGLDPAGHQCAGHGPQPRGGLPPLRRPLADRTPLQALEAAGPPR